MGREAVAGWCNMVFKGRRGKGSVTGRGGGGLGEKVRGWRVLNLRSRVDQKRGDLVGA